jgi:3-dehydroquinate dehydratase type I
MVKSAERDGADLIEIRMDYMQETYNLDEVRKLSSLPLIATNRPLREGGLFKGSEAERKRLLFSAADSGFDFIDIELSTEDASRIVKRLRDIGRRIIISNHIFDSTPNLLKLNQIFKKESKTQADVFKIVTLATKFEDNVRCLRFIKTASKKANVTCFCMGELGLTSRLLSPLFGGYFTYAAVKMGREAAPGQLTITEMRRFYDVIGC